MLVNRITEIRQRRYFALWVAMNQDVATSTSFSHEITAVEYAPVPGESIAVRVDVPSYRAQLPDLPQGASRWALVSALGGVPEWDTPDGTLVMGDIGVEQDLPSPAIHIHIGKADTIVVMQKDVTVVKGDDPATITITGLPTGIRVEAGEIVVG